MTTNEPLPDPLLDEERRITLRLLSYWESIKGDRKFADENDIDPDDISDIWGNCFLIQVRDITMVEDYNYTYLGDEIIRSYQAGISGDEEEQIVSPNAGKLQPCFHKVIETQLPLIQDGEFKNLKNQTVRYRQCLLPLGTTDDAVEAIFGGMRFKLYT